MRLAILFLLYIFTQTALAVSPPTCPSVETIHQKKNMWPYGGPWYPLTVENEELAMEKDIETFSQSVTQFDHAEWSYHFSETAHCFYQGDTTILLATNLLRPTNIHWQFSNNHDHAVCRSSSEEECEFGGVP